MRNNNYQHSFQVLFISWLPKRTCRSYLLQVDFALNDVPFTAVKENSDDDFNLRYNNKTYFSVKKIDVTDIDKMKITSNWSKKIIVALRNT
ncbi:hypothetical protein ACVR0I_07640 [Streptococcus macedonicus]